jgi:hypothetical protein
MANVHHMRAHRRARPTIDNPPKPKKEIKRPYSTHYFNDENDKTPDAVSHGACSSEEGAIRASIVRVFMGQYRKCIIIDRFTGVALYNLRVGAGGIQVRYGSGVEFKKYAAA